MSAYVRAFPAPRYSEPAANPNCAGPPVGDTACGRASGPATGIARIPSAD